MESEPLLIGTSWEDGNKCLFTSDRAQMTDRR
ncbi:rCG44681, partial [Rattus norvegicus]